MINDFQKDTQLIIIIVYLLLFIAFLNLLIITPFLSPWCEHSEHAVRMFGTLCAEFLNFGAYFRNILCLSQYV